MRKTFHYGVTRPLAWLLFFLTLCVFNAPPAGAFHRYIERKYPAGVLSPEQKAKRDRAEQAKKNAPPADVEPLDANLLKGIRASGVKRKGYFSGVLPWQRAFRDVNLCNGNLFKSFTDIKVKASRGGGLAFQRTYNSNDERVGPFGVGWSHAYEIRIEEAGNNEVPRTDFFGGKHSYHRDADGLYSPPAYMFDELSSEYENFLANGPGDVLEDTQKSMDGTVKHFVPNGNARTCDYIEDRHGNRTELTYGLNVGNTSLLTRVTDASGRYLQITWDNLGSTMAPAYRIVEVAGPYDANTSQPVYRVTYDYDGDCNLWKVHQDPAGLNRITTFTYTTVGGEAGLLASVSDGLNHTTSYTYQVRDDLSDTVWVGTVTEPTTGGSLTYTIAASPGGHGLTGGTAWEVTPRLPGGSSAAATVITDTRLRCGEMATGGTGGHLPSYTHHWNYDDQNNVTSTAGLVWRRSSSGTVQVPYPSQHNTFGPHGNVLETKVYNNTGLITISTTSYFPASKYFQKESVVDASGNTTYYEYYTNNDSNPGNRGQVKWIRDPRHTATGEQFEFTYNTFGQTLTETNLNNVVSESTYGDAWGNLTQIVQDPNGLERTTTTTYDIAGRVVSNTDPKGQASSYQYNGVGQLAVASLPGETISHTYGANGRSEAVTDGRGTTTLTYESGNDRVASIIDPITGTIGYTYNSLGQKLTSTLPGGGTWTFTYSSGWWAIPKGDDPSSAKPLLEKVTDDQGREVEYTSDNLGRPHEVKVVTSSSCTLKTQYTHDAGYGFNHRGMLLQVKNTRTVAGSMGFPVTEVLVQNDYTYDINGNRLTNTVSDDSGPIRTETYGYDELSRVTTVNYGDGETQSYTFDPMGNRLTKTVNGTTESYSYNNANMLLTRGSDNYSNDDNGNTLTGGGRTNTWDGQNRLSQCVFNGNTTSHTYGSDGLRRRTVDGATTYDFVIDGQSVVRTFSNSTIDRTYLVGLRGPEYERIGSSDPTWYLYDGLGSVLGTVDKNGVILSTRKYDVFGSVRASTGPTGTKHRFVGGLGHPSESETGLIYMQARFYDAVSGRFISEDPAKHGTNWFIYANQNPIRFVDPNGKVPAERDLLLDVLHWVFYIPWGAAKYIMEHLNDGEVHNVLKILGGTTAATEMTAAACAMRGMVIAAAIIASTCILSTVFVFAAIKAMIWLKEALE